MLLRYCRTKYRKRHKQEAALSVWYFSRIRQDLNCLDLDFFQFLFDKVREANNCYSVFS